MWTSRVLVSPHVVGPPDPVDQRVAGEHPAGVLHQQGQQLELLAPEVDVLAPDEDPVAVGVDLDVARRRRAPPCRAAVGAAPARRRAPARRGVRRSTARIRATSSRSR